MRSAGKAALITGATSGIGEADEASFIAGAAPPVGGGGVAG